MSCDDSGPRGDPGFLLGEGWMINSHSVCHIHFYCKVQYAWIGYKDEDRDVFKKPLVCYDICAAAAAIEMVLLHQSITLFPS